MLKTQFIRYVLVGVATNASSYILYLVFTAAGNSPTLVVSVLYPFTMAAGFIANKSLTFNFQGKSNLALMRFLVAHLLGYLLNLAILATFFNRLGLPHQLVQLAAIFIVAVFLFVTSRYFVFAERFA